MQLLGKAGVEDGRLEARYRAVRCRWDRLNPSDIGTYACRRRLFCGHGTCL
jgi:hypothetical protein